MHTPSQAHERGRPDRTRRRPADGIVPPKLARQLGEPAGISPMIQVCNCRWSRAGAGQELQSKGQSMRSRSPLPEATFQHG